MTLGSNGPGWLFCPADRPERFEKAAAAADVVILDLEDGVAAKDREVARAALIETPLEPSRTVVRVNPVATPDHELDLAALARTDYGTVMLAKTETAEQVSSLAPLDVVVLVETPLGALAVTETAVPSQSFPDHVCAPTTWSAGSEVPKIGDSATDDAARLFPAQSFVTIAVTVSRRLCTPDVNVMPTLAH